MSKNQNHSTINRNRTAPDGQGQRLASLVLSSPWLLIDATTDTQIYICGVDTCPHACEHDSETSDLVHSPLSHMEESSCCLNCVSNR